MILEEYLALPLNNGTVLQLFALYWVIRFGLYIVAIGKGKK